MVVVAGIAAAVAASIATASSTVVVMLGASSMQLIPATAQAGQVTLTLRNAGMVSRTVTVAGKTSPVVRPGQQVIFTVMIATGGSVVITSAGAAGSGAKKVAATLKVTGVAPAGTTTTTTAGTTTTANTQTTAVADGKTLFVKTGCVACHTLSAAGATGVSGPNLDLRKPTVAKVVQIVGSGGGAMQPYIGVLTTAQIDAVAQFVYTATHG